MTNLIPRWIARAWERDEDGGHFEAESLFLDVSGFTSMTEVLMHHGKDGAEVLSKIINEVFDPVLAEVEAAGGFVTTFAGDAFTALFPSDGRSPSGVLETSLRILNVFQRQPDRKTPWGEFALRAKVGLGSGEVEWGILGSQNSLGYFFRGPAVDLAARAEHHCLAGTVSWGPSMALEPPEGSSSVVSGDHTVVHPGLSSFVPARVESPPPLDPTLVSRFLPLDRFPSTAGEFRNLTSVFLTFDENARPLQDLYSVLARCSQETGGFFNLLDFGDKGGVALVLFGAPASLEDNFERASDFALAVVQALPEVSIGMAQGRCFSGYVGSSLRLTYTALGQVVNLSARLATSAKPGEILIPQGTGVLAAVYQCENLGERRYKGMARPVPVARLLAKSGSIPKYGLPPGVGRVTERSRLTGWMEGVASHGNGGVFMILGGAGYGKSQLASDVLSSIGQSVSYHILTCDPVFPRGFNPLQGYWAGVLGPQVSEIQARNRVRELVDELLTEGAPDYLHHEIRRSSPAFLRLAGLEIQGSEWDGLDPQARHDRTIEALVAYWSLQALRQPLILVIENAQALDKETAEFLERLLSRDKTLPLGVLLLSRVPVLLQLSHGEIVTLSLEPFAPDETALLVRRMLNADPSPGLLELLARRTTHIPLYVKELVRYLKENTLVRVVGTEAVIEEGQEAGLPRSLEDLILSQVDRLPQRLKAALPPLAVLGSSFADTTATELLGEGADELLQGTVEHGILQRGPGVFTFRQEFLRETVYQLQLGDALKALHRRGGLVLERVYPETRRAAGEKAYHFDRAQEPEKAKPYFRLAAEQAAEDFRNREALAAFERFLDLNQDPWENSQVRLQKARIQELVGDWNAARVELERGIGLAALAGQEDQFHRFFVLMGQIQFKQGNSVGAKSSLEKALGDPRAPRGPELVQGRIDLARVHLLHGQYDEALGWLRGAKDLAVEQGFSEEEGLALYYLGVVHRIRNRKAEAVATYRESLEIFRTLKKDRLIASPLYDLSLMFQHEGALDRAKASMEEAYEIYARIGYKSGLAAALLNLGAIEDQRGNFEAAIDSFRRSKNITEEIGEGLGTAYALFSLGATAYKQGEYPRALATLTEAHSMIERLGAESYKGYTLSYLACVLVKLGQGDRAVACASQQLEVMARIGDDVEKGRAFLALAELLDAGLELSAGGREQLQRVLTLSAAPRASAAWFYQAAIRSSRAANYIHTLIPALDGYGAFLKARGRPDLAEKAIGQAWARARKGGWTAYTRRMDSLHSRISS